MASLSFRNIEKAYGSVKVIHGIGFDIEDGEFVVLVGPSGCGKSTLLRMLAGLEEISGGEIHIDGRGSVAISDPRNALAMGIGLVSQEPSVVPQLDVAQNIFLGRRPALSLSRRREGLRESGYRSSGYRSGG